MTHAVVLRFDQTGACPVILRDDSGPLPGGDGVDRGGHLLGHVLPAGGREQHRPHEVVADEVAQPDHRVRHHALCS
jgi:hypothetical protein